MEERSNKSVDAANASEGATPATNDEPSTTKPSSRIIDRTSELAGSGFAIVGANPTSSSKPAENDEDKPSKTDESHAEWSDRMAQALVDGLNRGVREEMEKSKTRKP